MLKKERWCADSGIVQAPAPKSRAKTAVIINGVDSSFTEEIILEEMRKRNFSPAAAKRMKRAMDGAETGSVKIFLEEEVQIERAVKEGIFIKMFYHSAKRYIPAKLTQCHKCQKVNNHQTSNCQEERKCMKCSLRHHHSSCLAPKEQYLCANCQGNHSSNDPRCEVLKAAKESGSINEQQPTSSRLAPQEVPSGTSSNFPPIHRMIQPEMMSTSTQRGQWNGAAWNQMTPPAAQSGLQQQTTGANGIDKEQLNAAIKEAVKEAVAESFQLHSQNFFQEAAKSFATEMSKSASDIRAATLHLAALMERYIEDDEDEEEESENEEGNFERDINRNDCTSTPLPTGQRDTNNKQLES